MSILSSLAYRHVRGLIATALDSPRADLLEQFEAPVCQINSHQFFPPETVLPAVVITIAASASLFLFTFL
jgi:hypothetical protein